jgi:hypothetical protein
VDIVVANDELVVLVMVVGKTPNESTMGYMLFKCLCGICVNYFFSSKKDDKAQNIEIFGKKQKYDD